MGDIGALALGAALGVVAIDGAPGGGARHHGGAFVMETVSVILQVASFKLTGRRIFNMAPLHHHYESKGWPEPRVSVRFAIITVVLVLIGLSSLRLAMPANDPPKKQKTKHHRDRRPRRDRAVRCRFLARHGEAFAVTDSRTCPPGLTDSSRASFRGRPARAGLFRPSPVAGGPPVDREPRCDAAGARAGGGPGTRRRSRGRHRGLRPSCPGAGGGGDGHQRQEHRNEPRQRNGAGGRARGACRRQPGPAGAGFIGRWRARPLRAGAYPASRSRPPHPPATVAVVLNITDHSDRYERSMPYARRNAACTGEPGLGSSTATTRWSRPITEPDGPVVGFTVRAPEPRCFGLIPAEGGAWLAYEDERLMPVADSPIPGRHNVANALAALALGTAVGLPRGRWSVCSVVSTASRTAANGSGEPVGSIGTTTPKAPTSAPPAPRSRAWPRNVR